MARIVRLEESVVNRIAAGEVVQRPANAVKEMLENSLDAGATSLTVTTKQGGLKLLRIQDNGSGIQKEDMAIVCERFTTSKLRTFEDLQRIRTFGFRGEALASITHVAKVLITSRTTDSACAYKARYADGKMLPFKAGAKAGPQACAGNPGTSIEATDLFYNMPTRLRAFNNPSEQHRRIVEVVTRYAIHYASSGISFTCRKHGTPSADVHTPTGCGTRQAIKLTFGPSIERELMEFEAGDLVEASTSHTGMTLASTADDPEGGTASPSALTPVTAADGLRFAAKGFCTNPNFSSKKSVFILFINHRLVESVALKRTFESAYADILPRHGHPFVYLSLEVPPEHLDVNVHPTKKEVLFQYQDELLAALYAACRTRLESANQSRTFLMQTILPMALNASPPAEKRGADDHGDDAEWRDFTAGSGEENSEAASDLGSQKRRAEMTRNLPIISKKAKQKDPKKLVRTDANSQTLDAFVRHGVGLPKPRPFDFLAGCDHRDCDCAPSEGNKRSADPADIAAELTKSSVKMGQGRPPPSFRETRCSYDSVQSLLADIADHTDPTTLEKLKGHVFVGVASEEFSFIQFQTKLLLVQHGVLAREMFRQLAIRRFGIMGCLDLDVPLAIPSLVEPLCRPPSSSSASDGAIADGDASRLAVEIAKLLYSKAEMLEEYFRITVNAELQLETLPELLEGHTPVAHAMPRLLHRLATEVDWTDEQGCFASIAGVLGDCYAALPLQPDERADADGGGSAQEPRKPTSTAVDDLVRNTFFPAFRWAIKPSLAVVRQGSLVEVASLEKLYYVFERC